MSAQPHSYRLARRDCDLDAFAALVEQPTDPADYPLAARITQGVPVYDASALVLGPQASAQQRAALRDELTDALIAGPGIVVLEGAVSRDAAQRVTQVFWRLIEAQRLQGAPAGDHFAKPGANDRIWNALEKLAACDAEAFIDYHRSDALAVACEAWLGPRYQLTEQVNAVNPGGEAQQPHRDYHMGFLADDEAEQFPRPVHSLSPLLTLQGAIAHCDMGVETGPTMYLPNSHKYEAGYLAWRRPEFIDYFAEHRVQLPLSIGDAVFFSPAIFHAAGHNRTPDVARIANLLQISSAFGRSTETVDRKRLVKAVYPALRARVAAGMTLDAAANVVAACAEGYAFPTNLDRDQPVDGLAPYTQADLMRRALSQDWPQARLWLELDALQQRRRSTLGALPKLERHNPTENSSDLDASSASQACDGDEAQLGLDEMLAEARAQITSLDPQQLAELLTKPANDDKPAIVIDIRDSAARARDGTIDGSAWVPLTRLQWRCRLGQEHSHPALKSYDQMVVVMCDEGYCSVLTALSLRRLGFSRVADLDGGMAAWLAAGLPVTDVTDLSEAADMAQARTRPEGVER